MCKHWAKFHSVRWARTHAKLRPKYTQNRDICYSLVHVFHLIYANCFPMSNMRSLSHFLSRSQSYDIYLLTYPLCCGKSSFNKYNQSTVLHRCQNNHIKSNIYRQEQLDNDRNAEI